MLSLGMRLPRKSRDKTMTLHTCVWCVLCDLLNCCVKKNMHNMNFMYCVVCVLSDYHIGKT